MINISKRDWTLFFLGTLFLFVTMFFNGSSNTPSSIEVGIATPSPSGASGGYAIPASCPSYDHTPGECNPTASLVANPSTINQGSSSTLTWGSTGATSCSSPSGNIFGTSGSTVVTPNSTTAYTVNCTGVGGTASANATVTVIPTPPTLAGSPTTINSGDNTTLSWSCAASSSSSGVNFSTGGTTSGSASVSPSSTTQYSVICSNGGQASLTVTVLNPDLTITANPTLIQAGTTSTVTWSATNTEACTVTENNPSVTDSWSGTSGSQVTSALNEETTYTLNCTTEAGSISESVVIRLLPTFEEF